MRDRWAKRLVALFALAVLILAYIVNREDHMATTSLHSAPLLISRLVPGSFVARAAIIRSWVPAGLLVPKSASVVTTNPRLPTQHRPLHNTTSRRMGYEAFSLQDAIKHRRTVYQLTKKSSVSDERIREIVTQAIHDVPSSFNSQSTRLVVLVKNQHDKFWQVVTDILKAHVPESAWEHTKQRMDMFSGAYGTVR